jgi:hypothetical protein
MKNLCTVVVMSVFLSLSVFTTSAQGHIPTNEPDLNKPKLFSNLPERIHINANELEGYFAASVGTSTQLNLAADMSQKFEGNLISLSSRSTDGVQTAIIRSTNYNGARLTVTKKQNEDGTTSYLGRIISFQHSDLYELQNIQGQWFLVKRNYYDLINE